MQPANRSRRKNPRKTNGQPVALPKAGEKKGRRGSPKPARKKAPATAAADHRREGSVSNVDDPVVLAKLLDVVDVVLADQPLVFPVHPRTRQKLAQFGLASRVSAQPQLRLVASILGLFDQRQDFVQALAFANGNDVARALILEDLLYALDGEALIVEQMPDAAQQHDILRPVVAAAAPALERTDGVETGFPETQDVLREVELFSSFGDGTECVWRLVQTAGLPGASNDGIALSLVYAAW